MAARSARDEPQCARSHGRFRAPAPPEPLALRDDRQNGVHRKNRPVALNRSTGLNGPASVKRYRAVLLDSRLRCGRVLRVARLT